MPHWSIYIASIFHFLTSVIYILNPYNAKVELLSICIKILTFACIPVNLISQNVGGVETNFGGVEAKLSGVETHFGGVETRSDRAQAF